MRVVAWLFHSSFLLILSAWLFFFAVILVSFVNTPHSILNWKRCICYFFSGVAWKFSFFFKWKSFMFSNILFIKDSDSLTDDLCWWICSPFSWGVISSIVKWGIEVVSVIVVNWVSTIGESKASHFCRVGSKNDTGSSGVFSNVKWFK